MNKFIKILLTQTTNDLLGLNKIKKINTNNLIKYEININFNYPQLNKEISPNTNNKLFMSVMKNEAPEYYFLIQDLNKSGIHLINVYTKISGWYLKNKDEENEENNLNDLVILFYSLKINEDVIDKKINELYNKYNINNINIIKKNTYIYNYDVLDNGILFITNDLFDLSKKLYIYIYAICEETNSFVCFNSYSLIESILKKSKKIFITYVKYFTNCNYIKEIYPNMISEYVITVDNKLYGQNNFIFIDKSNYIYKIYNNPLLENFEFRLLNIVDLTELPNNKKLFFSKIIYRGMCILLNEEYNTITINNEYSCINQSILQMFFIIKINFIFNSKNRIKIIDSNIKYKPIISSGEIKNRLI